MFMERLFLNLNANIIHFTPIMMKEMPTINHSISGKINIVSPATTTTKESIRKLQNKLLTILEVVLMVKKIKN